MCKISPTRKNICGHRVQEHHQIHAGVAVHSGELHYHPATARIAMGAHQNSAPTMASQQPVTAKPLTATKPSANCTSPWTRRALPWESAPTRQQAVPPQPRQKDQHQHDESMASSVSDRKPPATAPRRVTLGNVAPQIANGGHERCRTSTPSTRT